MFTDADAQKEMPCAFQYLAPMEEFFHTQAIFNSLWTYRDDPHMLRVTAKMVYPTK